jgi:anti-sigma regulatory factor (Ser/Thr protein kinase)
MHATRSGRPAEIGAEIAETLGVPAGDEAARVVLRRVGFALREAGWPARARADVALAVDEAVQNAVEHGSVPRAPIEVRIEAAPDRARVIVADRGRPGATTPEDAPPTPGVHDVRGRGRLIMRALADDVRWQRGPRAGTRVELVFSRDGAAA